MGEAALSKIKNDLATDKAAGKKVYKAFSALGDPSRFLIFKLILQYQGMLCVGDVARVLDVSASAASQQLSALEVHELVKRERKGQKIYYSIKHENPVVAPLLDMLNSRV